MADLITPKGYEMKPLSGDPDTLAGEVTRMKNVAATIEKLSGMLSDIHNKKNSQSQKIDKIRGTAGEAGDKLGKAKEIYNNTGWALDDYQQQLSVSVKNAKTAYDNATALLPSLNSAESAYNTAHTQHSTAQGADTSSMTPEQKAAHQKQVQESGTTLSNANTTKTKLEAEMAGYKKTWDTAKSDLDDAASKARGRIGKAVDHNPLKDSWWKSFLSTLSSIAGWVGLALLIVAIFCTGPLAIALLAIATALTVVKLLADVDLAIQYGGSWWDVAFDVIALVPFGKFFGKGLSMGDRFGNVGKDMLNTAKNMNPARWSKAARELDEALTVFSKSRKGNVLNGLLKQITKAGDGAPSRWNVLASLKAGGTAQAALAAHYAEALAGKGNLNGRAAIAALEKASAGQGLAYGSQLGAGIAFSTYVAAIRGDDWAVNQVQGMVNPQTHDGPTVDLKTRVLAPAMTVPAAQLADPYPNK